jgi:hypothetical protein
MFRIYREQFDFFLNLLSCYFCYFVQSKKKFLWLWKVFRKVCRRIWWRCTNIEIQKRQLFGLALWAQTGFRLCLLFSNSSWSSSPLTSGNFRLTSQKILILKENPLLSGLDLTPILYCFPIGLLLRGETSILCRLNSLSFEYYVWLFVRLLILL